MKAHLRFSALGGATVRGLDVGLVCDDTGAPARIGVWLGDEIVSVTAEPRLDRFERLAAAIDAAREVSR